ncbi:uncharacterized protein LOC131673117 [Phymastichus coffea]|uniref:uncharacterized protein LOC131673117 n=1 Tax=Phymastichus coffea TaxID=108790 RepID=UPI00273CD21F|nr:uncharacterized protein LOC131673117 [Phymastichus coffea]
MASNCYPEQYRAIGDVLLPLRTPDDDELSIIDVNAFDDSADEKWLYSTGSGSRNNSVETNIEDLDAWLHADVPESDAGQCDNNSRRSIDTRTFTRIKRRSNNKLNFQNIDAMFSPEAMPCPLTNVWKAQPILESPIQVNLHLKYNENNNTIHKERRDSIPMMLRPKINQTLSTFSSESPSSIQSQASMEAFLNLAKSKEGMPMLSEMTEPDISSLLMNVSQPSLLYSSIISDGKNDETIQSTEVGDCLIDSQILTDSMMEASMFKEVQDATMLAEFLKQSSDDTMLVDRTVCKLSDTFDLNDKTFINELSDKTYVHCKAMDLKSSNQTYTSSKNSKSNDIILNFPLQFSADEANSTKILSHENLLNNTHVISTPNSLNSTRIIPDQIVMASLTKTIDNKNKTDLASDLKTSQLLKGGKLDATFDTYRSSAGNILHLSGSNKNAKTALDTTYDAVPNLREELLQEVRRSTENKLDSTFTTAPSTNIEPKLDLTYDRPNSGGSSNEAETFDATYVRESPTRELESQNVKKNFDITYDTSQQINLKTNSAHNMQRLSYANRNVEESQTLGQNRFNTYRKDIKSQSRLSKAPSVSENRTNRLSTVTHGGNAKMNNNLNTQKFNTYKKNSSVKNNNIDDNNLNENKLDSTFVKPAERVQSKLQAPRQFSKLPQLFQKSNPNLSVNMRPPGKFGLDIGFNKGSQPNIMTSNMNTLSRFKSEGRLLQSKDLKSSELLKGDSSSRSMESIDSSESAHSAPDFEDRINLCSNSSRASYTIKPRNLQILKKLGSLEEGGKFGGSTPKIKSHTILENNWVQEKDLPSPILKNGNARSYTENADSRSASPSDSAEFLTKTSSPITVTPASSDLAINTVGNDNVDIEAKKENNQSADNVQPKQLKAHTGMPLTNATKLRRPTNWTGGAKTANGTSSGIPRPTSRIPAPKFTRPSLK